MPSGFDIPKPITPGAQKELYISAYLQMERRGHRTVAETKYAEVLTLMTEASEEKPGPIRAASPGNATTLGTFYRPEKQPVTMRLDSAGIARLKAEGRGYQTKANWLLRHAMLQFTTAKNHNDRNFTRQRSKTKHLKRKP
jgi:uncharacterized protein (DUF4415 family)